MKHQPRCPFCGRFVKTDDVGAFVCENCHRWMIPVTVEAFRRYGRIITEPR